jgi:hypothetical protein
MPGVGSLSVRKTPVLRSLYVSTGKGPWLMYGLIGIVFS